MLEISALKITHAIARAKAHDDSSGSWDRQIERGFQEARGGPMLDAYLSVSAGGSLPEFINALDGDEKASLLAVAWIGRGSYAPEHLANAIDKAKSEDINKSDGYLIGIPLLADYLLEGMQKLGLTLADGPQVRAGDAAHPA